ncbi:aminodeoxychorismate synthase component I [Desulfobotulus sp. H1]|uniref:aminodeoxychorismate synthase n=1 Tax=Desulfobotulus pelophilus TaxID=2823377 RepID=A0ABT3NBM1_9BACT|nr:aminodeoxychorismate synthase component I [Desulfobotulus pelophilus]MCW7754815.1 aminodeoxychorismate synthase component I [Desulfobotulus pelophilus]
MNPLSYLKPEGFCTRTLHLTEEFSLSAFGPAGTEGSMILVSGGEHPEAVMNGFACLPFLSIRCEKGRALLRHGDTCLQSNRPLDLMDTLLNACAMEEKESSGFPFGLFGYFSYDLKNHLEKLPDTVMDDLQLPEFLLFAPRVVGWIPPHSSELHMKALFLRNETSETAEKALDEAERLLSCRPAQEELKKAEERDKTCSLSSSFSKENYQKAVRIIRDHISKGEVYQVNLSQRFSLTYKGNPYLLFLKMATEAPQPFSAFLQAGDFQLASLSPERFLRVRHGRIESHPIKGTRPRGQTPEEDRRLQKELETSIKDGAELAMIVDLVRNDIGRIGAWGSICVDVPARTEAWPHLFHRVAIVSGNLAEGASPGQILRATFPPGSVTGCPKIRAMEIIDYLEPLRRHAYTGAMGYLGFDGSMDLNVAIRTVICSDGKAHYSAGGGVVWDSDPEEEYEETLHKAAPFFRAMHKVPESPADSREPLVWQDGHFLPLSHSGFPMHIPALRHGRGVFETIRIRQGSPLHLGEHLQRLNDSAEPVTGKRLPAIQWKHIIATLTKANPMAAKEGQLHILALDTGRPCLSPAAMLTPLTAAANKEGIRLICHPEPFFSPMARHKSLAYVFFARARERALAEGGDEALIRAPDGSILEGSFSSLLLFSGKRLRIPEGPSLTGITRKKLLDYLQTQGWLAEETKLFMEDLEGGNLLLCCSSLRGLSWVRSVDHIQFPEPDPAWLASMRKALGYE